MIYADIPGAYRIVCDECETEPEGVGFLSFREGLGWANSHGWVVRFDKQTRDHDTYCPACARAMGLLPPDPEPPAWMKGGNRK